jgi:hypothetical protein
MPVSSLKPKHNTKAMFISSRKWAHMQNLAGDTVDFIRSRMRMYTSHGGLSGSHVISAGKSSFTVSHLCARLRIFLLLPMRARRLLNIA